MDRLMLFSTSGLVAQATIFINNVCCAVLEVPKWNVFFQNLAVPDIFFLTSMKYGRYTPGQL